MEAGSSQPPSVRLSWRVMLHLGFKMIKISKVSKDKYIMFVERQIKILQQILTINTMNYRGGQYFSCRLT